MKSLSPEAWVPSFGKADTRPPPELAIARKLHIQSPQPWRVANQQILCTGVNVLMAGIMEAHLSLSNCTLYSSGTDSWTAVLVSNPVNIGFCFANGPICGLTVLSDGKKNDLLARQQLQFPKLPEIYLMLKLVFIESWGTSGGIPYERNAIHKLVSRERRNTISLQLGHELTIRHIVSRIHRSLSCKL